MDLSEESGQSTESGHDNSDAAELEHGGTVAHESVVGCTNNSGSRLAARGWGRVSRSLGVGRVRGSAWTRGTLIRSALVGSTLVGSTLGAQAGGIITWTDGDRTAPTLLTGAIQNRDQDLSSGRNGDFRPLIRVGVNRVTKVGNIVAAGVAGGNDDNIIRAGGLVPGKGSGLALGECGSVNREVSSDTEGGESEKESSGEKSGVHRRVTF